MVKKTTGMGCSMRTKIRAKNILFILAVISFALMLIMPSAYSTILAESSWPSYKRDIRNSGLSDHHTENLTDEIRWVFETDRFIISSVTIGSDGTLYIGSSDNTLYAIKTNGILKWSYETNGEVRTDPLIDEQGNIYFGSRDGYFYSLNEKGELRWRYQTGGRIDSSPVMGYNDDIYFGSEDGIFYSLSQDGLLNWGFDRADGEISVSPAIDEDGNIIFGSLDGNVYSISEHGNLNWQFETGGSIRSSPAIDNFGNIYVGSNDKNIYSLSSDGSKRWNYTTDNWIPSSPTIGPEGNIYVSSTDGNLYALNIEGKYLWSFSSNDIFRSSPVICSDGIIYIGDTYGYLYAINNNGETKWSIPIRSDIYSTVTISSDDVIYLGALNGKLYSIGMSQEVPSEPLDLNIKQDENGLLLSWEEPSYKGMSTDLEYYIYRGTSPENLTYLSSTSKSEYSDTDIDEEETYYYEVTAVNEYGESLPSEKVDIDISDEGGLALTEIDRGILVFASIVLSLITIIGFSVTLKRRKQFKGDVCHQEDGDKENNNYIMCPHCGHRIVIEDENNCNLECSRCKSMI